MSVSKPENGCDIGCAAKCFELIQQTHQKLVNNFGNKSTQICEENGWTIEEPSTPRQIDSGSVLGFHQTPEIKDWVLEFVRILCFSDFGWDFRLN